MKTFRVLIGEEMYKARRGIVPPGCESKPEKTVCPHCKRHTAKKKGAADLIQFGFEWDEHVTVFRCKCGGYFFAQYKLWHIEEKTS